MSYDLSLVDRTGRAVLLAQDHNRRGGTMQVGGTPTAELNVTYNYSETLHSVIKNPETNETGVQSLSGLTPERSIPLLEAALEQLPDERPSDDYWEHTPGNVRECVMNLLQLARECRMQHPDSKWEVQ